MATAHLNHVRQSKLTEHIFAKILTSFCWELAPWTKNILSI